MRQIISDTDNAVDRLGAGTGIFTRALLAHPDWAESIKELRAVEPSEGMRDVFTKTVSDPRVSVREGTFDTTGIEDGWADLVVIAQVWETSLITLLATCIVLISVRICRRHSIGARTTTRPSPSSLGSSSRRASSRSSGIWKTGMLLLVSCQLVQC